MKKEHYDLIPDNHKCRRCELGKEFVNFGVFKREFNKPYVRKICNGCRRLEELNNKLNKSVALQLKDMND